ncbi:hypothetical protein ABRY23_02100 [Melioribacteraceae bacterium 4301-Me]|uniref:hypothetical protein n=1 Tax=Pyranulibacter aquaticus TaxID=3163344 RepID=UPI003598F338
MKNILKRIVFFFLFLFSHPLVAQNNYLVSTVTDTFKVSENNSYKISSVNIIPFSETVRVGNKPLSRNEYLISYSKAFFQLINSKNYSLNDTIYITYSTVKISLRTTYNRRKLIIKYDKKLKDTIKTEELGSINFSSESIFGKNIQKSGSLVRGITIGTNNDFTINSGLRLQLSGKLSDEIEVVAALTDENTPIQPEGNTETLEELDKVFIEIKHKNAVGTFGDYTLTDKLSEFSQLNRKLQGLKAEFFFGNNAGVISFASSRGKFATNQFYGQDGNQGPYRLTGANNERDIIIIAGSERVYLDGEELKRGDNNDYVIDYSNSEINFTPKRIITSASRISVDFEYTDRKFQRNFFGANYSTKFLNDKIKFGLSYYREADDPNSPIDVSLNSDQLEILKKAGDDRNKAIVSGVSLAPPDSSGKILGIYSKVDTLINNQPFSYYVYKPGSPGSIYNVSFTYVGLGNGDYSKESIGNFKFVGKNLGSYLPVIFLPMPEIKQQATFFMSSEILKDVFANVEISGSSWDKNRFSNIDDNGNFGYARKFYLNVEPRDVNIGKINIGKVGFKYNERFLQDNFSALDRINDVEFNRYYNIPTLALGNQILREISLSLIPIKQITFFSQYGYLKQGDTFSSDRYLTQLSINNESKYSANYTLDYVKSKNTAIITKWNRQNGAIEYNLGFVKPKIDFLYEDKEETLPQKPDSLIQSSLNYIEIGPGISINKIKGLNFNLKYSFRRESFPLNGIMKTQSNAFTQQYQVSYNASKVFSTSVNVAFRDKKITSDFKKHGLVNNQTVLILSQSKFNFWQNAIKGDLYYQASTEQTSKLQKVFVRVQQGTGNYKYLGDLNNNGIADENEFEPTIYDGDYVLVTYPTDQLYPVMNLKLNTRWKIEFADFFKEKNFWGTIFNPISTETSFRIEENSNLTDTKQIYLLNLSKFLNDSTTIQGVQYFQNDINIFKNKSDFSLRFRYIQRKNLNQYSTGLERGYFNERSLRIRFNMLKEINNQTDIIFQNDNLISPPATNRAREVKSANFVSDFSYRPISNLEFGFKISAGQSQNYYTSIPTVINSNSLALRLTWSLANLGRVRTELQRTELTANSSNVNIPFEITKGNVIGKNYFLQFNFDYNIASNLLLTFSYNGRLQGDTKIIHTMRAEARAYF